MIFTLVIQVIPVCLALAGGFGVVFTAYQATILTGAASDFHMD